MATHRISIFTCLAAAAFIFLHSSSPVTSHCRILLHHPLFPLDSSPSPNPTLPHAPPPPTPSSALPLSSTPAASADPFFPTYPSLSPPPPDTSSSSAGARGLPTFPANISSLVVPRSRTSSSSSSHSSTRTPKLIAIAVVLCLVAVSLLASFAFLRRRHISKKPPEHNQHTPHSSSAALFHRAGAGPGAPTASSEFLYMGTRGLESPEIRPLPPLRPHSHRLPNSDEEEEEEEFHSILSSSSSRRRGGVQTPKLASYAESSSSSPVPSVVLNSPSDDEISNSCSPHYILRPPPTTIIPPPPPPPPPVLPKPARSGFKSGEQKNMQLHRRGVSESRDGIGKPKLKGLHWDKVRATSDRLMVWDQLQSGSFALNEEMMETLFTVSTTSMGAKDLPRRTMAPMMNQEYRVLDPKKSQNIAILLRALNVTVEEVCDSLLEGNADMLGTELLESLLKMTPTEEEERKLREYKDESPLKLGPAEKFLKAVLDIPFAFKRVDAMLYIANFDSEVEYLGRSFEALEVACEELRNSRMFLKLLEAVLKTGNRMNVGTNRGDAEAFKLDTLLKLVDVKGADGKTTLLHFVVQEIIKAEGARLSDPEAGNSPTASSSLHDGMETRKQSLQIVASLCGELTNVKKAAAMDSDVVANDVLKLVKGVEKVEDIARLHVEAELPNKSQHMRFVDSMNVFLKRAGGEITRIQALESSSLSKVKELTEYFHGNSAKEEAHPLRIFMVVRDFLSVLDKVCKEVAKVNERTIISSNRQCGMPVNPTLPQLFPDHNNNEKQDEELPF